MVGHQGIREAIGTVVFTILRVGGYAMVVLREEGGDSCFGM